jgi:serralysin
MTIVWNSNKIGVSRVLLFFVCILFLTPNTPVNAGRLQDGREAGVVVASSGCNPTINQAFADQTLKLINAERTEHGVPALKLQNQLAMAALLHSEDMACRDFFSHINPDGKTPYDRITMQGYAFRAASENIYGGDGKFYSPESALRTWRGSSIHEKNILNRNFTEVGIGVVHQSGTQYGGYFTVVFAEPAR